MSNIQNNTIIKWDPNNLQLENVIASLNQNNIFQLNSMSDDGYHWIKFYQDGNIETHGDVHKAAEYLINQCWHLFYNPDQYSVFDIKNCTVTIFNYFKIHLGEKTVTHTGNYLSPGFYQLKEVIERAVLRKLRLIAFW